MDSSTVEHSDSDSGESWTLLENIATYGTKESDFPESAAIPSERENLEIHSEKDEDTDGISIISDSDPESSPCEISNAKCSEESCPAKQENTPLLATTPPNNYISSDTVREETDFLGDKIKYKTYVHKRNPKVGNILDIIMLGTFVITAGMALGHLWSCKNECTTQTSVNKILSSLYKLHEENAYLRNKLKEIMAATGYQLLDQKKSANEKIPNKQHRCKKIFEEPIITNKNEENVIKCVNDNKHEIPQGLVAMPDHEKEFLKDINKMKEIYNQNKIWLDDEVMKQFKNVAKLNSHNDANVNQAMKTKVKSNEKPLQTHKLPVNSENVKILHGIDNEYNNVMDTHKKSNVGKQISTSEALQSKEDVKTDLNILPSLRQLNIDLQIGDQDTNKKYPENNLSEPAKVSLEKKITYADSLKIDQPLQRSQMSENDMPQRYSKDHVGKRKRTDESILFNLNSFSEDDIKKDDRYTGPKMKHEKKKHDRQKSHKKQKRGNKYEQWEMKGGYMRDYDEFSVSSQDNDVFLTNPERRFLNPDFEKYINKFIDTENNVSSNRDQPKVMKKKDDKNKVEKHILKTEKAKKNKSKNSEWYDKRTALRAEARMKLEQELFGENTSNNAAWYFRRMQKREQCRAQKDNSTFKKFSKRKMNFKMKR